MRSSQPANEADYRQVEAWRTVSTGTIGHFLTDGFLDWELQSVYRPVKMAGRALTVASPPTDNSIFREAIEQAGPGQVLVISRFGDRRHASWGGLMSLAAKLKGIEGVVVDGAATDWAEITEMQFPVFCRNLSALTARRQRLGGTIGEPVACGGITVRTGDFVLGDADGVVVVPDAMVDDVLRRAVAKEQQEEEMRRLLKGGKSQREVAEALGIT